MRNDKEYLHADSMQKMAADPVGTRLASANAGSGKTRVLVDRVSRILLAGTEPEKILCLTYTKAAASEMQSRLFETLGKWSILPEDELNSALEKLLPEGEALPELSTARTLFAKALETPEGLKVQTIHAFCERVLSRFPIEAGILPGFEPIDDADMRVLRDGVRDDIYRAAALNMDGELNAALQILTAEKADQTMDDLFKWMANSPEKIKTWSDNGGTKLLATLLNLSDNANADDIYRAAWADTDVDHMRRMAAGLAGSPSKTDITAGDTMLEASHTPDPIEAFLMYASAFLTQKGEPRKKMTTQKAPEDVQEFFAADGTEVLRVLTAYEQARAAKTLVMTRSLLIVSKEYAQRYVQAKRLRRGLDFNDQILLVRNLLNRSEVSDWVRYKLDGGIEHILVDEAQDTSPEQWDIIDALSDAFIQDVPGRKDARTMFAVGDEKQSIYSFQGAKPERFLGQIQKYVGTEGKAINMRMSFRSAQEILDVVDEVLNSNQALMRMFDAEEFPPATNISKHTAFRNNDHGQVDLWPAVPRPEKSDDNEPWDTSPVDALESSDSREQLAAKIAETIKYWLDNAEPIYDRDTKATRPMQAGDILILVRQRNAFFDAVIRNLKTIGVPVAGADRLKLKESIAVKDLLSLGKFVLLPSDDLSLAEILKSPLFGWNDDALYQVAFGREGSLWQAVQDKSPDTAASLEDMITYSRRYAPYEFFARVLDMVINGESLMKRIFGRLGLEAKDAVEAFLARALAHQRRSFPSLQHFVQSFAQDEQEIKREMDTSAGQVRVMTVHGAKGLEAPVVFLPDTTQTPKASSAIIPVSVGFALPPNSADLPNALQTYKDAGNAAKKREYLRLLYVAMTRAESRLIICGYMHGRGTGTVAKESWYVEAQQAFENLETKTIETPFGDGLSFGVGAAPPKDIAANDTVDNTALPDWINDAAPKEASALRRVTPSHLLADVSKDMPVRSPLSSNSEVRFSRGNLIHKLLEILPDVQRDNRRSAAEKILSSYADINKAQIIDEVFAVLDNPEFAQIFVPGSRAEISLAGTASGLPQHLYLNAQIDRISVTDSEVFIVDYKSNRPPPQTLDGVAPIYWGQMAAYRELAREVYPGRKVTCALLWTDGPRLMVLAEKGLDEALTQIAALPT